MKEKKKLVFGVGRNDADYAIKHIVNGVLVTCPFYTAWCNMLKRGFCAKFKGKNPAYDLVSVCNEWLLFSNFKKWMIQHDWEDNHLDKDIIFQGNKVYSPDACCFVSSQLNQLLNSRAAKRGDYPLGVHFNKINIKYRAQIRIKGRLISLGCFITPMQAHAAWQKAKSDYIEQAANEQTDERIKKALLLRVNQLRDDLANGLETIKL